MRNFVIRLLGEKCQQCGIVDWVKKKLRFDVDHINGDRQDNRIDNLRVLCPNCHTQTATYSSLNISEAGRKRLRENGHNTQRILHIKALVD